MPLPFPAVSSPISKNTAESTYMDLETISLNDRDGCDFVVVDVRNGEQQYLILKLNR